MGSLKVPLAGNPNCGKSTLFNALTGARRHVGNYPGITVDRHELTLCMEGTDITLVDLPGTYSLNAYSEEEVVARNVLVDEKPHMVIDVVNAAALERNLYLAVQMREMGLPLVLALNMMDEAKDAGLEINVKKMSELFGSPMVPCVARKGKGVPDVVHVAVHYANAITGKTSAGSWCREEDCLGKKCEYHQGYEKHHEGEEHVKQGEHNHHEHDKKHSKHSHHDEKCHGEDCLKHEYKQYKELDHKAHKAHKAHKEHKEHKHKEYKEHKEYKHKDKHWGKMDHPEQIFPHWNSMVESARNREPLKISYGPDIDPMILSMQKIIEEASFLTQRYPSRWIALKYLEEDSLVMQEGQAHNSSLDMHLRQMVEQLSKHLYDTLETTADALLADYRHGFIAALLRQCVRHRPKQEWASQHRQELSRRLDSVLTHRLLGPLILLAVLYLTYQITLVIGAVPMGWLEAGFGWLSDTAANLLPDGLLQSLVVSGIIDGVGGVLGFVPLIFLLFLVIAFLEDSGYMARMAHMLDRIFRAFGLHGCSVMPFIISGGIPGGCAVPGIMATRTLRSPLERLATMMVAPYLSCGAKLPIFLLIVGVFFPENQQSLVLFLLTLASWGMALVVALILRKTVLSGPATPFVLELPPYRLPTMRGLFIHAWERTSQYIKKAGTVILAISVVLWAAMTFPGLPEQQQEIFSTQRTQLENTLQGEQLEQALHEVNAIQAKETLEGSLAGRAGRALEPVSQWAGFDWRVNIALIAGMAAKEVVVSTLGTAYSLGDVDPEESTSLGDRLRAEPSWSIANALAMLVFVMFYAPCFVTLVMIRRESGSWKWAVFSLVFNTLLAFLLAVGVYQALS